MKVAALLMVVSGAVVVAALSSATVQSQSTAVLVSAPAAAAPMTARVNAPRTASRAVSRSVSRIAAPARPAYLDLTRGARTVALHRAEAGTRAARVDVLTCSHAWSETGQCPGRQVDVLRGVALSTAAQEVRLPRGAHVRVSTTSGGVQVDAVQPALPHLP